MSVAVVTTSRADYSFYRPVLEELRARGEHVELLVSGAHLEDAHGGSVAELEEDGWTIAWRHRLPLDDDSPRGASRAAAEALVGFAGYLETSHPDVLVVLGDRYEMHAAALAALPARVPVAHLHGGEVTSGAIDDALRHGITKLSHLHFAATPVAGRRILQLGEEPWRVHVTGSPRIDDLVRAAPMTAEELAATIGLPFDPAPVLLTFHPTTLAPDEDVDTVLEAVARFERPLLITAPNLDPGGRGIRARIDAFAASRPNTVVVANLGGVVYASVLARAAVMVGNSSSGLIEAPTFSLPVVNIGERQAGRERAANVIDVECRTEPIEAAIERALQPAFRDSLDGLENPYGDGRAAPRIVDVLLDDRRVHELVCKRFVDLSETGT